jgi:hypothetical protein
MISIQETVEELLKNDYRAYCAMRLGYLNLSAYARMIHARVEELTKKTVKIASVVVSLARIEKGLVKKDSPKVLISQIAIHSPIVQLVYLKDSKSLSDFAKILSSFRDREDTFFAFSSNASEIAVVLSESLEKQVSLGFSARPSLRKQGLCTVGIRFNEKHVKDANIGLMLLEKIASQDIILDAALTTYNEFTLVFDNSYLHSVIEALKM